MELTVDVLKETYNSKNIETIKIEVSMNIYKSEIKRKYKFIALMNIPKFNFKGKLNIGILDETYKLKCNIFQIWKI